MHLLDFYKSRLGSAVKQQGNGWNGPCPLCGGEAGKSDRFVVWPDRDENIGEVCAQNHITGIWSCRRCGQSGDTIAYLTQMEGMSFKEALAELGVKGSSQNHARRHAPAEPIRSASFAPRVWPEPSAEWRAYATKLLDEATARINSEPYALRWLAARGITSSAIEKFRLGYLPAEGNKYPGRWRHRTALGLQPKTKVDGTVQIKIFVPRGIVIPTFGADGALQNLRIRRHQEDLRPMANGKLSPKYMELEGSCKAPMLLRATGPAHLAAYFITEAELDAMLIHHASGGAVGAVAVRTNLGKPDAATHQRLTTAVKVCVALDYDSMLDEQGQEYVPADAPGSQGLNWWEQTYSQYLRWPTPEGKDPGDAYRLGVDIREWVAAALPASIALPESSGQVDFCATGLLNVGGGAKPEMVSPEEGSGPAGLGQQTHASGVNAHGLTDDEAERIIGALPAYLTLEDVPADVCRAWLLWQDVPVKFIKSRDAAGNSVGFAWEWDHAWKRKHVAAFDAFWRFQDGSPTLWGWMSDHIEKTITVRNLLRIWGE